MKTINSKHKVYKYATIILFVISVLLTGVTIYLIRTPNHSFKSEFPYISIARNFIAQEDVIVNLQPLRDTLAEIYKDYDTEKISLYIESLNTGANISFNQNYRYYPASLIKMPVAVAAVKMVEDGIWDWDSKLVIFEEDVDTGFGTVGNNAIGTRVTIEELLKELLTKSDNTAYKMLLRNLGVGPVNDFLLKTGLNDFFDQDLNITAKEYTRLFRSLYTSDYLTRSYSQKILEWLAESERNYLGQGIPLETTYSHKFGENADEYIFADSGIVYLRDRHYVITVLYKGTPGEEKDHIDGFFERISVATYDYFRNFNAN